MTGKIPQITILFRFGMNRNEYRYWKKAIAGDGFMPMT
jgi:hypothetical protein